MRIAALYDVHGNLPALEAVLADPRLATADRIVVGGDLVAGPFPVECLERLCAFGEQVQFVRGNGDRETVMPPDAGPPAVVGRFARGLLREEQLAFVASWPLTVEVEVDGLGPTLFCHATPTADTVILTRATPDADVAAALGPIAVGTVVCGHTHVQFDRQLDVGRVVNAGSVGMPYEGSPDARWALLGPEVDLVATPYDVSLAREALAATGFPDLEESFGAMLRGEISAAEATAFFERRRIEAEAADGC